MIYSEKKAMILDYRTVNMEVATGTYNVPSCDIGTRITIRKLNADETQAITINTPSGETITRSALTSIVIYGNGGNWTIEKVTATRWEIIAGSDRASNANGNWIKYPNGELRQNKYINSVLATTSVTGATIGAGNWYFYYGGLSITFPIAFVTVDSISGACTGAIFNVLSVTSNVFYCEPYSWKTSVTIISYEAIGTWY